jgi:hypothetical protein
MSRIATASIVPLLGLLALAAWAQDAPAEGEAAAESPPAAQRQPTDRPPPPPSAQRPAPRDDGFVPSEELQADEEVTFPVDI